MAHAFLIIKSIEDLKYSKIPPFPSWLSAYIFKFARALTILSNFCLSIVSMENTEPRETPSAYLNAMRLRLQELVIEYKQEIDNYFTTQFSFERPLPDFCSVFQPMRFDISDLFDQMLFLI